MKKKKEQPLIINKASLNRAQKKIAKLRPIRDDLTYKLQNIHGFAGIVIQDKIKIFTVNNQAKETIENILDSKIKSLVRIVVIQAPERKKFGGAMHNGPDGGNG